MKLRVLSTLRDRLGLLGEQFGGNRKLYDVLGYKQSLSFENYWNRYKRDDIAGRVVDAPARATWRAEPRIVLNEEDHTEKNNAVEEFNKQWKKLNKRLALMSAIERADRLAGIGRYSILLIGVRDSRQLDAPIGQVESQEDVLFIAPYSEVNAQILEYEDDPTNSRFGLPKLYSVRLFSDEFGSRRSESSTVTKRTSVTQETKVHHSRVIHIAEGLLEDNVFGEPRLRRVYNRFDDLAKVSGGSAEFYWILANRGLHLNIEADAEMSAEEEANIRDELEDYFNGVQRFIATRGADLNTLGSESSDPRGVFQILISLISGATGIPQRILLGSERGQLASVEDRNNWSERILERQRDYGEDVILRPFLNRLMSIGALPLLEDYGVLWPEMQVMTEKEAAEVAARYAQSIVNVSQQKQLVVTPEEFRKNALSSWNLSEKPEGTDIIPPQTPNGVDRGVV